MSFVGTKACHIIVLREENLARANKRRPGAFQITLLKAVALITLDLFKKWLWILDLSLTSAGFIHSTEFHKPHP
jgi:hypothetical protein